MAIPFAAVENALHAWLATATGIVCIWAEQDGPQPATPYCIMRLDGPFRATQSDELRSITNLGNAAGQEVEQTWIKQREIVVHLQAFADSQVEGGSSPARDYLDRADEQLDLESVLDTLATSGLIVVGEPRTVQNVSTVVETRWQSRAMLDVRFRLTDSVMEKTGFVDGVIFNPLPTFT